MFYLRLQLVRRPTRFLNIYVMLLNVSQRKSAIFVLSSIVGMTLADKLLLYIRKMTVTVFTKKIQGLAVKVTKIGRFAERPTPYNRPPL